MRRSAVRRFAADASLVAAGGRAILLQIADPVVAAGVARHSDFVRNPQRRLAHTLMYVYAVVLGTPADARTAAAFVNHAHAPVPGADDTDRQRWVAATLYDSAIAMHEVLHTPVSPSLRAGVLAAYEPLGSALRMPAGTWPDSVIAFERYWETALAGLEVTDDARSVARDLLHPRLAPWWIRAVMPPVRVVTVGLLPTSIRDAYGFAWGPVEERRYLRTIGMLRRVVRAIPGPVRRLPWRVLVGAMRRAASDPPHR